MRPIIGITAWLRSLPTYLGEQTALYTVAREYVDHVVAAGGLPVILPRGEDAGEILRSIDGLLLTGGDDLHPESYGEARSEASRGTDREADRWEIALVRGAAASSLPALGICRGMQVMSVAFGGRLLQDLHGAEGHPDLGEMRPAQILSQRHPVRLVDGCALARLYDRPERPVNTIHHQAVVDPGTLRPVGHGPGGVIEAVEADGDWPAIGVQWHPEKMDDPEEQRLFVHFVAEARRYAERRAGETAAAPGGVRAR